MRDGRQQRAARERAEGDVRRLAKEAEAAAAGRQRLEEAFGRAMGELRCVQLWGWEGCRPARGPHRLCLCIRYGLMGRGGWVGGPLAAVLATLFCRLAVQVMDGQTAAACCSSARSWRQQCRRRAVAAAMVLSPSANASMATSAACNNVTPCHDRHMTVTCDSWPCLPASPAPTHH